MRAAIKLHFAHLPALLLGLFVLAIPAFGYPYRTSFEAPGFNLGAIEGQDGWTGIGQIQDASPSLVNRGTQSLEISQTSTVSRSFVNGPSSGKVYIDGFYRGPTISTLPSASSLGEGSSILVFHDTQGIVALNGDGVGGGTWVSSGIPVSTSGLQRITICQDYSSKTWELYIDQVLAPGGPFGFKDNSITQFNGIDIETSDSGKGYLDDFSATNAVPEFFDNALFDFSLEWDHETGMNETPLDWDLAPMDDKVDGRDLLELLNRVLGQ